VNYTAPSGCITPASVEIFLYEPVSISGFIQQYCQVDSNYLLTLLPDGGTFTINGIETNPIINPVNLGTGVHELFYKRGVGACASSERRFITVLEPISQISQLESDSICLGQQAVVEIIAQGGLGTLTYIWDQGLGFGNSQIVRPEESTWYRVMVSDNCSDPLVDSVLIHVYQPFTIPVVQGDPVCYEDTTFAQINLIPASEYQIIWQTNPPLIQPRYDGRPGVYQVEVTELTSGCTQTIPITLPGALPIKSNFSLYPNQPCIDIINNEIEIIDLSLGYTSGWIDFGDGSPVFDMTLPGSINHAYRDTGTFIIKQVIFNDLGCADSLQRSICVENRVRLFVPTGFSPNDDGVNDRLELYGLGIEDVQWQIFDRQGGLMFRGTGLEDSWDGTHNGRGVTREPILS
jgi:gliding motility-associated-like protein